ncbi:hypothetical protein [Kitasatospora acidiphila]|uniref:hypothetical protein n=1 Tax=Kitasatospora acidiphila TaxID=2567942 RepID=UPI003C78959C
MAFRQAMELLVMDDIRRKAAVERQRIWRILCEIPSLDASQRRRIQARYIRAWRRNQYHSAPQYRNISFSIFLIVALGYSIFAVAIGGVTGSNDAKWPAVPTYLFTAIAVAAGANSCIAMAYDGRRYFSSRWAHRSDLLLARLIVVTATFYNARASWRHASECRRLRYRVTSLAKEMESTRVRVRRTGQEERKARRFIRDQNVRVAAVLRRHAEVLSVAGTQQEYERICRSLTAGLLAASEDNWEGLLENSPDITFMSRIQRLSARLGPAAFLLAAAFLLPLFPGLHGASASIYGTLLPVATLTALGAPEVVLNSIRSVIDKSSSK